MLAVTGSNPAVYVRFFLLAFGALGRKSQRAQKGELCAAALEEVASLRVCRESLIFPFCFVACFSVLVSYTCILAVTGSNPTVYVRLFLLAFGALGSKSQRAHKGELCAAALGEFSSLGVCRGSVIFSVLFVACFADLV